MTFERVLRKYLYVRTCVVINLQASVTNKTFYCDFLDLLTILWRITLSRGGEEVEESLLLGHV